MFTVKKLSSIFADLKFSIFVEPTHYSMRSFVIFKQMPGYYNLLNDDTVF